GTPHVGEKLTVNYTITDLEGDPYSPTIQWSRSDTEGGSYIPIAGANSAEYIITTADKNKYLKVEVTPTATTGTSPGTTVFRTIQVANIAPVATITGISGTPHVGEKLTLNYSITDLEGDPYSATIQWSRSDTEAGSYIPIAGANSAEYTVTTADKNKYIKVEVTPTASSGTSPGTTVFRTIQVSNTPPTVNISSISGAPNVGQTISVEYTLSDLEGDPTSATFQWFRGVSAIGPFTAIGAAINQGYTVTADDRGKYLRVEVTPHASSGSTPGDVRSGTIQVLNAPPVASNVYIAGTAKYSSSVTANFTYGDVDQDSPGTPTYKWFIASVKNGSYTQITGATQITYTIKLEDVGKYIFFEVTPVALSGELLGTPKNSDTVYIQNQAPVASNVYIQGNLEYGSIVRGKYTYSDLENNAQGTSLFKWYRAESSSGLNKTAIPGANMETYVIQLADLGQFISFEVTPMASSGTITGVPVGSSFAGPLLNAAPKATNLQIMGTQAVCRVLTGQYTYTDSEGDEEGYTTFRWFRASVINGTKTEIPGATQITYTLTLEDQGKYIFFEVTPRASSGGINGTPVTSAGTGAILNLLPTVTFSGGTSICAGKTANLSLSFSGTPPFILYYTNGSQKYSLNTASNLYTLPVTEGGTYKADSLKDNVGCTVTNLPSQTTVNLNPLPDVQITGLNEAYSVYGPAVPLTGTPVNGTFSGPGVVPAARLFYPNIAGVANSPHAIVYSYTASNTGCSNTDTVWVKVLEANASMSGLRTELRYCNFDKAFLITGVNSKGVNGTFTITGGVGLSDNGNNTATINPLQLTAGSYTISYSYMDNILQTINKVITVETIERARIINAPDLTYCQNTSSVKLTGNYSAGIFSGSGISLKLADFYFSPTQANAGSNKVYYSYSTTYGCKTTDSLTFNVLAIPNVQFEVSNRCWGKDSTTFINLSGPVASINSWSWNFGDNTASETKNRSAKYQPKYLYPSSGDKTVSLIAQNTSGCKDTITKVIHLSDIPKVDFSWDKECFVGSANVAFSNKTVSAEPNASYLWTFTDASGVPILLNTKDVSLSFPQKMQYNVKLRVTNTTSCKDSTTKTLSLRSIHFVKDSTYNNDFESDKKRWFVAPGNGSNWQWNNPDGSIIGCSHSGTKAHYTKILTPRSDKQLDISSNCFDFTDVQKPFFEMWINTNTETGKEGAQLQYISDDSAEWRTVGSLGSGLNWYNDNAIAALPSSSRIGWSGNTDGWIPVRHNLDQLKDQKNIKFRILYGVNATSLPKDGFAFDDILIGQRGKSVLFEHFTNQSNAASVAANAELYKLMDMAGVDAYSIQYHTSFPGADTMNMRNPQDPASRVLYYGIGTVPASILDGGFDTRYKYDFVSHHPNIEDVNLRSLIDPDFDLEITAQYNVPLISGSVKVKSRKSIADRNISLYIAVVEDVTVQNGNTTMVYYNVLKKFLPAAGGTQLKTSWANNEVVTVDYFWNSQYIYNSDKVKIVAYIQDEQTREVYQVRMLKASPVVSVRPVPDSNSKLVTRFYPNPVVATATLEFSVALQKDVMAQIVDKNGRILNTTILQRGINEYIADFTEYPNGLYFIRIVHEGTKPEVLKVMVLH
ncbi:MAG TPA: PKD domain-containing protein, partial [Bacteroidales bacterium]|nr:PKD domain-containing protein [Bacteroidales bacterium]